MNKKLDYLIGYLKAKQRDLDYIDLEGGLYDDSFIEDFREYAEKVLRTTE